MDQSKDKGLYPLIRHIENYFNEHIIRAVDDRFIMKFTGVSTETQQEALERQNLERTFKKTLNEIRAEDGLPPMPGGDEIILGPEFMQWYEKFSPKALELQKQTMEAEQAKMDANGGEDGDGFDHSEDSIYSGDNFEANAISPEDADPVPGEEGIGKALWKSKRRVSKKRKPKRVKIEYYTTD